jgi:RNA polymerase sigma factor (sigma-70 family)
MTRTGTSPILHLIRRVVEAHGLKDLADQELLRRFLTDRDKEAFNALLRRHGSMVLDVCRNVLGNEQDAEDAFQATFLVLAQKAGAIRKSASVGSWLYGVAYRTASQARLRLVRRQRHEAACPRRNEALQPDDLSWREVQQLLHAELNRLPERYRAPLVHCYLEGKSQEEAARLLGVSRGTLQKRLDGGRASLRIRLVRQGLGPAAALAASAWPSAEASALVPSVLMDSTVKAAALIGTGGAGKGLISPKVLALTEGVLKAMFLTKLKLISAVVMTVLVGTGLAGWSYRAAAQSDPFSQQANDRDPGSTRAERQARRAERPGPDELDALRREIDALRERVKVLEAEVRGRKDQPVNSYQRPQGAGYQERALQSYTEKPNYTLRTPAAEQPGDKVDQRGNWYISDQEGKRYVLDQDGKRYVLDQQGNQHAVPEKPGRPATGEYLAEAEAALKRLRQNPNDKQAAEALDRAARRLKAGAKGEEDASGSKPPQQE